MAEDMIEKVARAIYESRPRNKPWSILGQHQGIYLKAARAAIEALMEPSEAMYRACWPLHHPWGQNAPPPEERQSMYDEVKAKLRMNWQAALRTSLTGDTK